MRTDPEKATTLPLRLFAILWFTLAVAIGAEYLLERAGGVSSGIVIPGAIGLGVYAVTLGLLWLIRGPASLIRER